MTTVYELGASFLAAPEVVVSLWLGCQKITEKRWQKRPWVSRVLSQGRYGALTLAYLIVTRPLLIPPSIPTRYLKCRSVLLSYHRVSCYSVATAGPLLRRDC